jgi:hypothetical protein
MKSSHTKLGGMRFLVFFVLLELLLLGSTVQAQIPQPPTGLMPSGTAAPGATSVQLSWNLDPTATSYNVRANDNTGATPYPGNNCPPPHPHYFCVNGITTNSVTMLVVPGHNYTWFMHACNSAGCGSVTVVSFTVPTSVAAVPPAPPTGLAPSGTIAAGATSVQLSWNLDPTATSYNVRANDNTGATTYPGNNCPPPHPHYFCVNGIMANTFTMPVVPGHSYTWFMHACNGAGCGGVTVVSFTVPIGAPSTNTFPQAPANLTVICNNDGTQAAISWSSVAGADSYAPRLNYVENDGPQCALGGFYCPPLDWLNDAYPSTSYSASVVPNKPYQFWVHARQGNSYGDYVFKTFTCVPAPSIATCDGGGISVALGMGTPGSPTVCAYNRSAMSTDEVKALVRIADSSTVSKRPTDTQQKGLFGVDDRVVVTNSYVAWLSYTKSAAYSRSGGLTGIWTLEGPTFKHFLGLERVGDQPFLWPRNELIPGSEGKGATRPHHWDVFAPPTEHTIVVLRPDGQQAFLDHTYIQDAPAGSFAYSAPATISVNGLPALSFTTTGKMSGTVGGSTALTTLSIGSRHIRSTVEYRFFDDFIDSNWKFKTVSDPATGQPDPGNLSVVNLYMFLWLSYAPGFPNAAPCFPLTTTSMPEDPSRAGNTWATNLFARSTGVPIVGSHNGQRYDPTAPFYPGEPIQIPANGFCSGTNVDIYSPVPPAVSSSIQISPSASFAPEARKLRFENLGAVTNPDGSTSGATSFSFEKILAWKETFDGTQGIGIVRGPYAPANAYPLLKDVEYQAAFRIRTK